MLKTQGDFPPLTIFTPASKANVLVVGQKDKGMIDINHRIKNIQEKYMPALLVITKFYLSDFDCAKLI